MDEARLAAMDKLPGTVFSDYRFIEGRQSSGSGG